MPNHNFLNSYKYMNPIQQTVISEIVEKLDACNKLETPEPFFSIGKDVIPSCPPGADMRDFIDPLIEGMFLDKGFGYVRGLSNADELAFAKLSDEQKMQWVAQSIGIRIVSIVPNAIEGLDEFNSELSKYYNLSSEKQWAPACGSGVAIGIIVTVGGYYINNVAIPGFLWDQSKKVFQKLWDALYRLYQRNDDNLEVEMMEFRFNDITIRVHNRDLQSYVAMLKLFQGLNEHINNLQRKGIEDVNLIELPYVKAECEEQVVYNCEPYDSVDEYVWKVSYLNGCSELYYNPFSGEIEES